jgi:hypothetical protein
MQCLNVYEQTNNELYEETINSLFYHYNQLSIVYPLLILIFVIKEDIVNVY